MNSIHSSWIVCKVGELIKVKNGYAFKSTDYTKEGFPIIRISEINNGKIDLKNAVRIPKSKVNYDFQVNKGDLLMALSGATTGKVGVFNNDEVCFQNQRVGNFKIINEESLIKGFRNYFILSKRKEIELAAYGGAQPNISGSELEEMDFPLAPLNEQKRIVKKLDNLLTQVDESKKRLEKIPVILKRFRQSVLNTAITGELTKDWRERNFDTENGEQLYEKIQNHIDEWFQKESQKAVKQGKRKPKNQRSNPKARYIVEELSEIPSNWKYSRLEDLCYLVSDGTHKTPVYLSDGKKFLSVKNVRPFKIFDTDIKYISNEEYNFINARCNPEKGDILYTKVGATYGYAAKVNLDYPFSIFVSLALIKPVKEFFTSDYCEVVMNSELVFQQARSRISGIGTPDLHLIEIRDFRIPLPPQKEQKEIVKRVEALFKKADEIEERYKKAKAYVDKLTQSILAKAFRGELVLQDPNDEPAEKLLERVKAEKEKQSTEKGKRKKVIKDLIKRHPKALNKLSKG